jgi:predicted nucleic acid-binding protein
MTIGAADALFVDTNILVYASVPVAPLHGVAIRAMRDEAAAGAALWLSRHILRGFLATLSRPQAFGTPLSVSDLIDQVHRFEANYHIAEDGPTVTVELLRLLTRFPAGGKQVHDANIVATMRAHGLTRLLTHNTADFDRFAPVIIVVPLV